MKRTQIQLDEATYQALRRRAYEQGVSMSSVLREALGEYLGTRQERKRRPRDFHFIAVGRSRQGRLKPVSERHDEALAEDFAR